MKSILVIGAGSWGTALALQLAYAGHNVEINSWQQKHNFDMIEAHGNFKYLPDNTFPDNLKAITSWQDNIAKYDEIIIATPSKGFMQTIHVLKESAINNNQGLIIATKGFDHCNYKLLSEIIEENLKNNYAILTGPSFAKEVANKLPSAVLIASPNFDFATHIQHLFSSKTFRCYTSSDVVGAQVGGAVKNIIAIAAGIADGMGFGANSHAALITRGLKEISRLGINLGAKESTFLGLSCMGDLILTCSDNQSRNRRFGLYLGQGANIDEATHKINQVVEGYIVTKSVYKIAQKNNIDMPIVNAIYNILYESKPIEKAVNDLLSRSLKIENP